MPSRKRRAFLKLLTGLAALGLPASSRAADFPSHVVRIIVPSSPGGALDVLARILAPPLTELWGQPVIVDDHAGANGIVGTEMGARATPDGTTLTILAPNFTINPFIYKTLPYSAADFQPITVVGTTPAVVAVHPSAPFRSIRELIDVAKQTPGRVTFGSSGIGSSGQMQLVMLERLAGVQFRHIPYRGAGAATTDVVGGHVNMEATAIGAALPFIKTGQLIPIAVTTASRSAVLPDVPTIAEQGFPGYDVPLWYGLFAPAATPAGIVAKLHTDVVAALRRPDITKLINDLGLDVGANTPDQFSAFIAAELKNWEVTVKAAGIQPQ